MKNQFAQNHKFGSHQLHIKRKKTGWVLVISALTMVLEILFGYFTNSMALLSNGWHMATHVIFIGIGWLTYQYVIFNNKKGIHINTGRVLAYVGFINALIIAYVAIRVGLKSIERFSHPIDIKYKEAFLFAVLAGVVNLLCARILHHEKGHSDYNLKATYLHIIGDVLTAVLTLVALIIGFYFQYPKADAIVGLIGALVILYWAQNIILHSGKEIFLNFKSK